MKRKRLACYLLVFMWTGMNTFFVLAIQTHTVKNLNASSAIAYYNLETNAATSADKAWILSFNRTSIENNTGVTNLMIRCWWLPKQAI
jgi:hypothetical protein